MLLIYHWQNYTKLSVQSYNIIVDNNLDHFWDSGAFPDISEGLNFKNS